MSGSYGSVVARVFLECCFYMIEQACLQTIEDGIITKDLAELSVVEEKIIVNAESFSREVNKRMFTRL